MSDPTGFPGFAPGEHRKLIADLNKWRRTTGWTWGWIRGLVNADSTRNATIAVDWQPAGNNPQGFTVARRDDGTGRWTSPDFYPAADVRQAVDLLVAVGVLPARFSSAYGVEAVIADREAQAASPEVVNAVAFTLEMELRGWLGPHYIAEEHLRRIAARLMGSAAWVRPAAPGCDCSATGGQGLVPTASREHADDCPAVTR